MFRTLITNAAALVAGVVLTTSLDVVPAQAQSVITINNATCSATGTPDALVISCTGNGGGGGGTAPSGCSLSPVSQTVASGGIATITAFCSGGTVPITHTLSGGAFAGMTAIQQTLSSGVQIPANVSANTTVTGTANNSGGQVSDGSASVTVSGGGGGGGGGGGLAACTSAGYTVVGGNALNLPLGVPQAGNASFGDTQAWVFAITVPAGTPNSTVNGSLTVIGNGGNELWRNGVISTTPCDFNNGTPLDSCRNTPTCSVQFGIKATGGSGLSTAALRPGQTYYLSFRDWSDFANGSAGGGGTCGAGANCAQTYSYQQAH